MEDNKLITRDQLKTYFETGKYPTQSQFSDLIDSLKHKEDTLNRRELLILANSLVTIDDATFYYTTNNIDDIKMQVAISSSNEEDQMITIKNAMSLGAVKQYLLGSAPYSAEIKKTVSGDLNGTVYYSLNYALNKSYRISRLFGNNLPGIPDGFYLGEMNNFNVALEINKADFGQKIEIINTKIKFINKTEVPIQYMVSSQYWGDRARSEDSVTDHYSAWDFLIFNFNADLRAFTQSVRCDIFDADNDTLLATGYLQGGINQDRWIGGQVRQTRNVRIECAYFEVQE